MKKELIFSLVGYACLLIVGTVMGLWIHVTGVTKTFQEAQQLYNSYFPAAIANGRLLCAICIGIAGIGIFSINAANKHILSKTWKTVNTVVIVLLGWMLFLNVWSLMQVCPALARLSHSYRSGTGGTVSLYRSTQHSLLLLPQVEKYIIELL